MQRSRERLARPRLSSSPSRQYTLPGTFSPFTHTLACTSAHVAHNVAVNYLSHHLLPPPAAPHQRLSSYLHRVVKHFVAALQDAGRPFLDGGVAFRYDAWGDSSGFRGRGGAVWGRRERA